MRSSSVKSLVRVVFLVVLGLVGAVLAAVPGAQAQDDPVVDPEVEPAEEEEEVTPLTDTERLVEAAYAGLLGRESDEAGREFWSQLIDSGSRAGDIVGVIGDADEHRRFIVAQFYRQILQREPEPEGLAFWSEGIIDRFTAASLAVEIYSSEEFFLRSGATNDSYIAGLYQNILNREPEPDGLEYWSSLLDDGVSRSAVTREILRSTEGILQPELSIESATPSPGGTGDLRVIEIDLDRAVDPDRTAIIVSAAGRRLSGTVSGDPDDPSIVRFAADVPGSVPAGQNVVVTVFATTPGDEPVVESIDFSFVSAALALSTGADPEGELIVAFYGHPRTDVLGIAGEGTPEEALARLIAQAAPYEVTGRPIVPAFEMISTLVTAAPGADNLYRSRATEEELWRYLDTIRTVEGRLILDIQPGRADVLDEARAYESLLLEPEVGLALDPEWVVGPTQTPKGRIGTLDAADINRVSAYLSELALANDLEPRILIIHRFNPGMVTNTDLIETRPGVRIIFHADGEGGPGAKIADYDNLMPARFEKGIKIFYDEDSPTMTPAELLARTNPDPTFISYQ